MASLTGQQINTTYTGLLKTSANTSIPTTGAQVITDGAGNATPLELSQTQARFNIPSGGQAEITGDNLIIADAAQNNGIEVVAGQVNFAGNMDFSGATVTGLPGGGGGLQSINSGYAVNTVFDNDAVITSMLVPANSIQSQTTFQLYINCDFNTPGGWHYTGMFIGPTPTLFPSAYGATIVQAPGINAGTKAFIISVEDNTGLGALGTMLTDPNTLQWSSQSYPPYNYPIDWTVDQYIVIQGYIDSGAGHYGAVNGMTLIY